MAFVDVHFPGNVAGLIEVRQARHERLGLGGGVHFAGLGEDFGLVRAQDTAKHHAFLDGDLVGDDGVFFFFEAGPDAVDFRLEGISSDDLDVFACAGVCACEKSDGEVRGGELGGWGYGFLCVCCVPYLRVLSAWFMSGVSV